MASTYLSLINNVLSDMNEVELTASSFATSRGIQTAVKDYINRSIDDIINSDTELNMALHCLTSYDNNNNRYTTIHKETTTKTID